MEGRERGGVGMWEGGGQKAQLGPRYHSHLMERGPGISEFQDRYSRSVYPLNAHVAGQVKDTWSRTPGPGRTSCSQEPASQQSGNKGAMNEWTFYVSVSQI